MAQHYDKIVSVISKPPQLRTDFELTPLLPWFRKKTDIFRWLKTELLLDVLKNCQYVSKKRDDVLIKQGEKGDCFYIILSGQVTIFIKYAKVQDASDETSREQAQSVARPEIDDTARRVIDRNKLGTLVCSLGVGESFGEVALITEDCIRTATIVADEAMDVICIDRDLYTRSVKMVLEREFQDKARFIQENPFFSNWAPRYKKQLAMAFRKDTLHYESVIAKQGDPVKEIYFILNGEVKLSVNPSLHQYQYKHLLDHLIQETNPDSAMRKPSQMRKIRSLCPKPIPICLLGKNELIGDTEVLFDLNTHIQTSVCNTEVDVLVLGIRHFERLIAKRNPQAIEVMRRSMAQRIHNRIGHSVDQVPLYKAVLDKSKYMAHQSGETTPRDYKRTVGFTLPPRGPVIDLFGPGTVFHRIRRRAKIMEAKNKALRRALEQQKRARPMGPTHSASYKTPEQRADENAKSLTLPAVVLPHHVPSNQTQSRPHHGRLSLGSEVVYDLSCKKLDDLEYRMGVWLGDSAKHITPLHRVFPPVKISV